MNGSWHHFEYQPPRSWDAFEELCADTFQDEWQDPMLVRNGRAGQAQQGVDILGRSGATWPIGIQCKRKAVWPVKKLTIKDVNQEIEKAKQFLPPLKTFIIVSTAPDDEHLQKYAREISQRHEAEGLFSLSILGWGEIVRRATRHRHVAAKHFGTHAQGSPSPLLASWRTVDGKLQFSDRELSIGLRELIHEFGDFPEGRIVVRRSESEILQFDINQRRASSKVSLADREEILALRDRLKRYRDEERLLATGLILLLTHKDLRDFLRVVWIKSAPLLVRSFIEQGFDRGLEVPTSLQPFRVHPPGDDEWSTVYLTRSQSSAVLKRESELNKKYPRLDTDRVGELPEAVQFGVAMPAVLRWIVLELEDSSIERIKNRDWLNFSAWKWSWG